MPTKDRIKKIAINDPLYPRLLREIKNPPQNLFGLGNIEDLDKPAIAIVGTRKATSLGKNTAENIAYKFGKMGFTIVSGLALGIDTAAHVGALKAGAKTVAVLGNKLPQIYPAENTNLAKRIIGSGGAIISEQGTNSLGHRGVFLDRNRIISGLSAATICVEVPLKSGAANTAGWAADQGRPLFVIPGPINHPNYRGSHNLIRDGATLAGGAEDIMEDLGLAHKIQIPRKKQIRFKNESSKMIFDIIKQAGASISAEEIIETAGLPPSAVSVNLAELLIDNIIAETADGYTILNN